MTIINFERAAELKKKFGINFTAFADIEQAAHKKHLINNFLGAGEMSCLFGPPGCGKSVLAGDLAAHVAEGREWFGHRTTHGGVLYVAGERPFLVKRRLAGFGLYHGSGDLPLAVISGDLDLRSDRKSVDGIIACSKQLEDDSDVQTRLIILDTISRLLNGDENSSKDVGAFINNVARVQEATGAHVLLVHHVPHEANRMRGHGSALAAMDTTIRVEKLGNIRTATVEKNNDGEEGEQISFTLESFEIGTDPETKEPTTAPIVRPAAAPTKVTAVKLTKNQQTMFSMLHDAGAGGLSTEEWSEKARGVGIGVKRHADHYDIRESLKAKKSCASTATDGTSLFEIQPKGQTPCSTARIRSPI